MGCYTYQLFAHVYTRLSLIIYIHMERHLKLSNVTFPRYRLYYPYDKCMERPETTKVTSYREEICFLDFPVCILDMKGTRILYPRKSYLSYWLVNGLPSCLRQLLDDVHCQTKELFGTKS